MKSTGIVRNIDNLGRLVVPKELRETMDISVRDAFEIFVEGERIIFQKYEPACIFCGDASDIVRFENRNVCKKCINRMSKI